MKPKIIVLTITILLTYSCKINGSFQGLYSYYHKTRTAAPELFAYHDSINNCEISKELSRKIIITNGIQLKSCFSSKKDIIYMWSPKCRSEFCYDLNILQQRCIQKEINLFVVAEYYDLKHMSLEYNLTNPIFAINTEYYKTNLTSKYCELFYQDLVNQKTVNNRLLYFENGVFINSYDDTNALN